MADMVRHTLEWQLPSMGGSRGVASLQSLESDGVLYQ